VEDPTFLPMGFIHLEVGHHHLQKIGGKKTSKNKSGRLEPIFFPAPGICGWGEMFFQRLLDHILATSEEIHVFCAWSLIFGSQILDL